ncbi:UNVERIFIED_CONTAM: hypothetical protein FKN15_076744 [Acipenser sinensis]
MARVWSFALVVAVLGTTLANDQAGGDGCSGIFEDLLGVGLDPKSFDSGAVYAAHLDDISDAESCVKACCGNGQCSLALLNRTGARARCHLVNCVAEGTGANACISTPNAAYDSYRKREGDSRSSNDDEEKCHAPIKVGPCRAAFPRFNYDPVNQTCREFIYGGCEGNANNYDSREECERTCAGVRDSCEVAPEVGPCEALMQRFFYNSTSGSCQTFIYGGCRGNDNNYLTQAECQAKCSADEASPDNTHQLSKRMAGPMKHSCEVAPEVGPCRAWMQCFFYNSTSGSCQTFIYGGCRGNNNNYLTQAECQAKCSADEASPDNTHQLSKRMAGPMKHSCEVAPEVGPCEALMQRFFYNSTSGSCQTFIYGGCRGNDNNYLTQAECQAKCSADEASPDNTHQLSKRMAGPMKFEVPAQDTGLIKEYRDSCEVAPEVGPCEALMQRFFYNSTSGSCQTFIYGGCRGNDNNYLTQAECQAKCSDHCLAQKEVGPCRAAFPSWYYNSATQDCLPFIYGGCEGNLNRYSSAQDCMRRCAEGPVYVLTAVLAVVMVILVMGLILISLRKARECHLLVVDDKEELLPSRSEKA